jgi:serpin B
MVHVTLPRFKFNTAPPIQAALQSLGLNQAFTSTADFSRMSRASFQLSQILHRAFVAVDEKGAEATAVTVIAVLESAPQDTGKPKWVDFIADHPFIFVIQDMDSGAILFMGHYLHP